MIRFAAFLALCALSCRNDPHDATLKAMHERTVRLTRENVDLLEKLTKSEQIQTSMVEDARRLRDALKIAELNALVRPDLPIMVPIAAAAQTPASSTESPRRGGFTDFGNSVSRVPVIAETAPTPRSGNQPAAVSPSISRGPLTSDPAIIAECADKWGNSFSMVAYCQKEQQKAKDKLATWDPYRIGGAGFDVIRKECAAKWGNDYGMRVYCEKQESEAYAQVNRTLR